MSGVSIGDSDLILAATAVVTVAIGREVLALVRRGELHLPGLAPAFVLTAGASSVVDILVTFTASSKQSTDIYGDVVTSTPAWAYYLQLLLLLAITFGAGVVITRRIFAPETVISWPTMCFFTAILLSDSSALLNGDDPFKHIYYVAFLAVMLAAALSSGGLGPVVGVGLFCATLMVCSGWAVAVNPSSTASACEAGTKCGVLGFAFRGVLGNENALALYLTLAMPFMYLAFGRRVGALAVVYALLLVLLTGSRSGTMAALVTTAVLLVVRPEMRRGQMPARGGIVAYAVLVVALVTGLALPLVSTDPRSYTGRGYLWQLALHTLNTTNSWWFGEGASGWQHIRNAGLIDFSSVYSVHNEWLEITFTAGFVGLLLCSGGIVTLLVQGLRAGYGVVVACVLVPVFCLGITERPWSVDILDWMAWSLPAAMLCYPRDRVPVSPGPVPLPGLASDRPSPASGSPGVAR